MAEYLKCNAEDLDDILMNVVECYFLIGFIEMMSLIATINFYKTRIKISAIF